MNPIVIGTRGSELAMRQAGLIRDALAAEHPGLEVTLRVVHTTGDRDLRSPAQQTSGKGMFTTEIEAELLSGSISLAVHSMKDLPTRLPDGLVVGAVTRREDPADVLVSSSGCVLADLPRRAKVLTGSPRRRALLLHRRPDLRVLPVRGNVPTRLRKLEESGADAVVLARAGLVRLGLSVSVTERLDPAEFVPACGQGALAVEIRQSDDELLRLVRAVDDPESRYAVAAERVFLADLGGGCHLPAGAYARRGDDGDSLVVTGMVADPEGSRVLLRTVSGAAGGADPARALGRALAEELLALGARKILDDLAAHRRAVSETDA